MKLIPFRWLPASWGLSGIAYERAEACYLYEGETLDRHLLDIDYPSGDETKSRQREAEKIRLDLHYGHITEDDAFERKTALELGEEREGKAAILEYRHQKGMITEYEFNREMITLHAGDETEKECALLRLDAEYGHIDIYEAEMRIATLNGEPYLGGDIRYNSAEGRIEFDYKWNDLWIAELRRNGYDGQTDDEVMQQWYFVINYNEVISHYPDGVDPVLYQQTQEALKSKILDAKFR